MRRVEGGTRWFNVHDKGRKTAAVTVGGICDGNGDLVERRFKRAAGVGSSKTKEDHLSFVQQLYDVKIGELGSHWTQSMPIEYRYATLKFGDVLEFFTDREGVLRVPKWKWFKFTLDQYLEERPATRFHPARVQELIDQHGVEHLDAMT